MEVECGMCCEIGIGFLNIILDGLHALKGL
jgi:hypothetical protein